MRSIEHANLIDAPTAERLAALGAFVVPTPATYECVAREGQSAGVPPAVLAKLGDLRAQSVRSLDLLACSGAKIAFGTDLSGELQRFQSEEFSLRRQVQSPAEIIRSATVTCAELFNEVGEIGVIQPGARADLLVAGGNPLEDLGILAEPEAHLDVILKAGAFVVNRLKA